jgi:hypothetical protein
MTAALHIIIPSEVPLPVRTQILDDALITHLTSLASHHITSILLQVKLAPHPTVDRVPKRLPVHIVGATNTTACRR